MSAAPSEAVQWRAVELSFSARSAPDKPMAVRLAAAFRGPDGARYDVPGFWDGGTAWKVRFAPPAPGRWTYRTSCEPPIEGLDGQEGALDAAAATGDNPLFRHGGFLRVSPNRRFLTYTDGTPFFWLGDTWWFCPSKLVPLDGSTSPDHPSMFKALIGTRRRQGFSVVQMAFLGFMKGAGRIDKPLAWGEKAIARWRQADAYIRYANDAGILPVIGLAFHSGMDRGSLADWTATWRYTIARLGALPVTWLICGEYNQKNVAPRVKKVLALGRAIKAMDPYRRAMTVHAWYFAGEGRQAWGEPWYDFIMLQGGHRCYPASATYKRAWNHTPARPVLEAECNYEGIHGMDDADVRWAAWRAVLAGSFGYTYGSHGLWYPTQIASDTKFSNWGKPMPWWEALARPGAGQMTHLRRCCESVDWWTLEPRPNAVATKQKLPERQHILAKARGDELFLVYFPKGVPPRLDAELRGLRPRVDYRASWLDPRTGQRREAPNCRAQAPGRSCLLPPRPDGEDWALIVQLLPSKP